MTDITDFQWDKMFAFYYGATQEQVENALALPFPGYVEFSRKIVFLRDGKIIHREELPTDIEAPVDGEVSFDIPAGQVYKMYTPETAVFKAEKKQRGSGAYYELEQIK